MEMVNESGKSNSRRINSMNERLFLPERLFGCIGIEMNLYFANIFTALDPANYFFRFSCDLGVAMKKDGIAFPSETRSGFMKHVFRS